MNKAWFASFLIFSYSCGNIGREPSIMASPEELPKIISDSSNFPSNADTTRINPPTTAPVKNPTGTYQFILSQDSVNIEQTIKFYSNRTFRLQERFRANDSVAITEGTWSPSNGFIWLYKQQVVRARYQWSGDTLQYFLPSGKHSYPLRKLPEISQNKTWKQRAGTSTVFFGLGNEPFWNIELTADSMFMKLADGDRQHRMKINSSSGTEGNLIYSGNSDSIEITLRIFPFFCSDGMSDHVYPQEIRVEYGEEILKGCGMRYKNTP
jgi:uncharacterized membrane protein